MPKPSVYVDGASVADVFVVDNVTGHRDAPRTTRPTRDVPGRVGPVLLSQVPAYGPRTLRLEGHVLGDTLTAMWAAWHELTSRLAGGQHEVTVVDNTARVYRAYLGQAQGIPLRPALWAPKTRLTVELTCYDPRAYSTGNSTLGFGSTDTPVPLGTAPSGGVVRISGAASAPSLVYKSSTGAELARITLNTTLGSTSWVDIDLDAYTLVDENSSSVAAAWASSVSRWLVLDPADGDYNSTAWPTLQVTAGSGALTYSKAWW